MSASSRRTERRTLKARLVAQFREPTGLAGRLAGRVMAARPSNRLRNRRTLELLGIAPHDTVLEIGHGPGFAIELACTRLTGGHLIGVDHSAVMSAQAARRNAGGIAAGRVTLLVGDILCLAPTLASFDKIYSVNVVQFWPDAKHVFATLRELLKPAGAIATTFMPRVGTDKLGQATAKAQELEATLAEAGFSAIQCHWLTERPAPAFCLIARQ